MKYDPSTAVELYIGEVVQLSNNIAFSDIDKEQALLTETIQRLMFINPGDQQKKEEKWTPLGPQLTPPGRRYTCGRNGQISIVCYYRVNAAHTIAIASDIFELPCI